MFPESRVLTLRPFLRHAFSGKSVGILCVKIPNCRAGGQLITRLGRGVSLAASSRGFASVNFNVSNDCKLQFKEKDKESVRNRKLHSRSSPSTLLSHNNASILTFIPEHNPYQKDRQSIASGLILLFLCSSAVYSIWLHVRRHVLEKEEDGNGERKQSCSWSDYITDLVLSSFTVNAAKPLLDDDLKSGSNPNFTPGGKDGKISRRQQFNFIADVLDLVQDAVVCIEVKDHSTTNWYGVPQVSSNGSGFIVKEDGLILTNAHVVASQQRNSITVKLQDGRCFAGYLEDVDYESDLATVRVKARGLPTLPLGCSSETRIGEWVVAVGSPLNLSNTVTTGVVSSTKRGANELGIGNDITYIQTDAAITFGNSGGPLINLDGEAIGINSMKVTPGISFAIPIDHAKKFLERAALRRATGKTKASRRYMGLTILTLTDQIRNELEARTGIKVATEGVFVWQIIRGGPAYLSGLQPGDVITNINGHQMRSAAQVHEIVKTDDKLAIEVQRGERKFTFVVVPENIIE